MQPGYDRSRAAKIRRRWRHDEVPVDRGPGHFPSGHIPPGHVPPVHSPARTILPPFLHFRSYHHHHHAPIYRQRLEEGILVSVSFLKIPRLMVRLGQEPTSWVG